MNRFSLVFPFSEVNAAVFQNAGIYHLKKGREILVKVFTPDEFAACYYHADFIHEITDLPYRNYSEVSNYSLKILSKCDLNSFVGPQLFNYILQFVQSKVSKKIFHKLPILLKSDYKARKFLLSSNIYKNVKLQSRKQNFEFLGTSNYVDLAKMEIHRCDIINSMSFNFFNLANMITEGGVNKVKNIKAEMEIRLADRNYSMVDHDLFKDVLEFIRTNRNVAYIRTRNISSAASVHNTKKKDLEDLIFGLLRLGYSVINSGTPTIAVSISNQNYLEVNHNFTILQQMYLASSCSIRVMSEEAGLFVAWASTEMPLVTFGKEWSITNLNKPISLIDARRQIGIKDIQLGMDFTYENLKMKLSI
jgi:hypothetical protein